MKNQPSKNINSSILNDIELDVVIGGQKTMAESIVMNTQGPKKVKNEILIRP